jgi:signal transduction histidine kinase
MNTATLPSLEQLIRAKIQRRIVAAMALLVAGAIVITIVETALSYSDLVFRLDRRADNLQDLIISEVLVHNHEATKHILADANQQSPDQSVEWIPPEKFVKPLASSGLSWQFPGSWTFVRPLKRLGDQDFGTFVFTGNFFTSGGLLNSMSNRVAFAVAICSLMALLLLPIARTTPKDLILAPVHQLLALLRDDQHSKLEIKPDYAEIKSIQDDFLGLVEDRRKLETQRLETAQLRTVTRTAQMLAHDIRRPFSLLKATLDGLTKTTTPESMKELIDATVPGVRRSLEHLEGIIEELTAVGLTTPAEKSMFSLADAVQRGIEVAAQSEADLKRITVSLKRNIKAFGVQNQIERVVANVITNALQAMCPNDLIDVELKGHANGSSVLTIHNSGSYIQPENIIRIFEPFYTHGKASGTGLGLTICKRVMTYHGGDIEVQSSPGQGTTFSLRLPPVCPGF